MHILYALIIISHVGYGDAMVTRAGLWESKWNCEQQRAAMLPALKIAGAREDFVRCIPVNG